MTDAAKAAPLAITTKGANDVTWRMVLVISIAMGGIISVALPIAFHYPKASDATSVLGVILPIFTALLGAALGTGVGNATGSAGKKAVEGQLSRTKGALRSVKAELPQLAAHVSSVFSEVQLGLGSPAGGAHYALLGTDIGEPGAQINITDIQGATASIARIQGLLQSVDNLE